MKYIRTKDEKIHEVHIESKRLIYVISNPGDDTYGFMNDIYPKTEIVKEADNIEELLDDVVYYIPGEGHFFELPAIYNSDTLIVYGAIWTDKGLIYVAKMTDKGELELL